jgi:4-hydroxy-tetrahydrodipicolinate synthase
MFRGSLVALITPFLKDGQIDENALRRLVWWHIENKTDGIVVCGTTGESPTLSDIEKIQIFKICVEEANKKIPIIAGTGSYNTKKSYELTKRAKEIGCDGALVVAPYYNRPTQLGITAHFNEVSKANLPIIVYHHPGRCGINIELDTFSNLEKITNVRAIKEASGSVEFIKKLQKTCQLPILSGDDSLAYASMGAGARGSISVVANVVPDAWSKMINLCLEKKFIEASVINYKNKELVDSMFLESNPQCVKYAAHLLKRCENVFRLPMIEPGFSNKKQIEKVLGVYK